MTLVNIDLRNQGYQTGPDDRVIFYSLLVREGEFGTISTAPVEVPLVDGKATVDLAPGPVGVQIIAGQVADTRVRIGEVPPSGPTTLSAVMMVTPAYTPALQAAMVSAVERAKEMALEQVDAEVSVAINAEVGEAIYSASTAAQTAASESSIARQAATSADARATAAEGKSDNAVSRVSALEVMGGLAPGEPVDGQTANLIEQDGSLTRAATSRAVTKSTGIFPVERYGAAGDGTTDDTAAIQAAVDAALGSGGGTVFFQSGKTYQSKTVNIEPGVVLDGYGATLLRPAMNGKWARMLTTQNRKYEGAADSEPIVIRGLTLDGNIHNQGPYLSYELEQASLIYIDAGSDTPGRVTVLLHDVTVTGSVSDGVHVRNNARVIANNLTAIDCFRGGLTLTGGNSDVKVDGYRASGDLVGACIDIEVDGAGYGGSYRMDVDIRDAVELTPSWKTNDFGGKGGSRVTVRDSIFLSSFYMHNGSSSEGFARTLFQDCILHTKTGFYGNSILNPQGSRFERCRFIGHGGHGTDNSIVNVISDNQSTNLPASSVYFIDCTWERAAGAGEGTTWAAITRGNGPTVDHMIYVLGGEIKSGLDRGISSPWGGLAVDRGLVIDAPTPIRLSNDGFRPAKTIIGDIRLGPSATMEFFSQSRHATATVEHRNFVIDESKNSIQSGVAGWSVLTNFVGRRTVMMSSAPISGVTTGIIGDIARLKAPVPGSTYEWVCTTSGVAASVWKPLTTIPA